METSDTPYQATASVIFNWAAVQYSIMTFGITGPCVAGLVSTGMLAEDIYAKFINSISNLIVEVYKSKDYYIVTPQPLFLFTE